MKRCIKFFVVTVFSLIMILGCTLAVSAAYYEPDGGSSAEYLFPASECNRTLIVNCVDTSGNLIKRVTYYTKRGEDDLISLSVYGMDIVGFDSDQGLWETCKITWASGTGQAKYGYVQIRYYFRTALSTDVMTATVTMRKSEAIEFTVRHYVQIRQQNSGYTYYSLKDSTSQTVDYYTYVTASSKYIAGYTLKSDYISSIGGNLSYQWMGNYANIPYSNFEYDFVNTLWSEDMDEYSTYDESDDGKLDYCINRKYFVNFYYDLNVYTISFNANGGSGAPDSIRKYYGTSITIPETVPTLEGYDFLGWGTYEDDTGVNYFPGDQYTSNANITLYAIWDQYDCDFSVTSLNLTMPDELFPNETISVRVRTDSWDENDPYENIPISLYYDGKLLHTEYVDYEAYGIVYVNFDLNIGSATGEHTVEAQVNWDNKTIEADTSNNARSTTIHVISDSYSFTVEAITPNAPYREGHDVISSYIVYNNSDRKVMPDADATAEFTVYFYCSNQKVILEKQTWNNLAIPKNESNLVYFQWSVPEDLAGNTVYCECTVNLDGRLKEGDISDNTATFSTVVEARNESQTENPTYEAQAPSEFTTTSAPSTQAGSAVWSIWEYENGTFVKRNYGICVTMYAPTIAPSLTCESAYYSDGKWTMKSGYGITLEFNQVTVGSLSGYSMPSSNAYTEVQSIYATFPEFRYVSIAGKCRALDFADGKWKFIENEGADGNERLHYIPVWLEDGQYIVSVTVTDIWTPVGAITAIRNSNVILIDGSIFDDYYVGG